MKKLITISLLFFILFSCRKDEESIVSDNTREYTPEIIQEEYGRAKVVGFVKDKTGQPLDGVRVFFGEHESITDGNGQFELTEVSAGNSKRIWFQKDGYALNQKLVDVREDLPNRVDAALFPISKTAKLTDEGGLIEGDDFSVEIQPGGFVYSDGEIVTGEVTVSVTPFLTSEDNFIDGFPGDFEGIREDGSTTAIESFGFIDVDLQDEDGEPVQLAKGVTATIQIKAHANAPATIPMWYYDFNRAEWIEEGIGTLVDGNYTAEVTHFTPWNWDDSVVPRSKIIGRVVDIGGNPIEGATIIQTGLNRTFQNSTKSGVEGRFELITLENLELELEAFFDIFGSTILVKTTASIQGSVNDFGDLIINERLNNILPPLISDDLIYITIGDTVLIRGKYFGEEKREGYKLLLNGNEVETTIWQSDLIEFIVPNDIPGEGIIQIDRDGFLSREVAYKEGDGTCLINNKQYDINSTSLSLKHLGINEIPYCIGNLRNLEKLSVHNNNNVSDIPESIGYLKKLRELVLSENHINKIPKSIGNLKNLKILYLRKNKLELLPDEIGYLSDLEILSLSYNNIYRIPETFGNLLDLKELYLNKNNLSTLPSSLGNLTNLKVLDLSNNNLTTIPDSFKNLTKLRGLILAKNPINESERERIEALIPTAIVHWE